MVSGLQDYLPYVMPCVLCRCQAQLTLPVHCKLSWSQQSVLL